MSPPPSAPLPLKILPFSLSNGRTQISSDASCDTAHLWWHGLLTSLVRYNTLSSCKRHIQAPGLMRQQNVLHRLGATPLSQEQTFILSNVQTRAVYWYKERLFNGIKEQKLCLRLTQTVQTLVPNHSKQRWETNTEPAGFRRTKHSPMCLTKTPKSASPSHVPLLKRHLHLLAFLLWGDFLQEEKGGVSKTWVTVFTETTFNPITATPCFYFLFHGIKIKWNIIKKM